MFLPLENEVSCLSVNSMNRSLMGESKREGTNRFCMHDHCENVTDSS